MSAWQQIDDAAAGKAVGCFLGLAVGDALGHVGRVLTTRQLCAA